MCGICGLFGQVEFVDPERIKRMTFSLEHRGPDQEAFFYSPTLALGIRRLAIVDRAGGRQPIKNETEHIQVVFNGEIYNYKELREMLQARGHSLRQAGDGEVIPHLYEEFGMDFPSKLRGTFAIALWDDKKHKLLLVRDRLGVKPLYLRYRHNGLAFASELRSLLIGESAPEVDLFALDQYLSYRYVPAPYTIFQEIYKLEPGTLLAANLKRSVVETKAYSYWQIPDLNNSYDFNQAAGAVRDALEEALKIRWPEEVPAAYFFSGGLDSAGLVALHNKNYSEPARTYAIGFERPSQTRDFRYYSELEQASAAAKLLNTCHFERIVTLEEVKKNLTWILTVMDEPIADPTAIPLHFLSEFAAAQGEKVVISGEGADELFGGYTTYLEPGNYRKYHSLPEWVKALAERGFPTKTKRFSLSLSERYFGVGGLLKESQKQELYTLDLKAELASLNQSCPARNILELPGYAEEERMLRFDLLSWLPENTLMKSDKMTMRHSLEMRLPYLDQHLVELGASLPYQLKLHSNQSKAVLRQALKQLLPKEIVDRPKNGFPVPITAWLMHEFRQEMRNVLLDSKARMLNYVNKNKLEELLKGEVSSRSARLIWALYTIETYLAYTVQPLKSSNVRLRLVQSHKPMRKLGANMI